MAFFLFQKKNINYKIEDSIAIITLNRSPSNAFTIQFLDEILNSLTKASKDKSVKVVVLESNIARLQRRTLPYYS